MRGSSELDDLLLVLALSLLAGMIFSSALILIRG